MIFRLLLLIFLISSPGLLASYAAEKPNLLSGTIEFRNRPFTLQAEIAATAADRETGLMYRQQLANESGMLFVFEEQHPIRVWMKNTLISLDILFLDQNAQVIDFVENLQPCHQINCPVYTSRQAASFMLELNAGYIRSHQLQIGDSLKLPF